MSAPKYGRILLKLSGEFLAGSRGSGIDAEKLEYIYKEIKEVKELGIEIGIVVGGGNIWRGEKSISQFPIDRASSDQIGMLATVINAVAIKNFFCKKKLPARVQTTIEMNKIAELFIKEKAINFLEKGEIVIFAGGTGNPYFTTDTAAILKGLEIGADVVLKATKVDGVYDTDPVTSSGAKMINYISYIDVLMNRLKVMDATAVSLSMDNNMPIIVFNIGRPGNLKRIIEGENIGTKIQ